MASHSPIIIRTISILLGILFILGGALKITTYISKDLHKEIRRDFVSYAKVFPFSQLIGVKVPAKWYRKIMGWIEIICGLILAFVPKELLKQISNITMIILMALGVYSNFMTCCLNNEKLFEKMAPTLIYLIILIGRFAINWQIKKQAAEINAETKQD